MKVRDVLRILEANGWKLDRMRGSHPILRHRRESGTVTVGYAEEHPEGVEAIGQTMAMKYAVVIEKSANNYAAYVPDLPGCVATGASVDEVRALIREGIGYHVESLRENGEPVPPPSTAVEQIEIPDPISMA